MLAYPDLESYLVKLGDALIFIGDAFTEGGMEPLGAKEGDVTFATNKELNNLTFPEATGPAVHDSELQGEDPTFTIPIILGNPDLWERTMTVAPGGTVPTPGGGFSSPQPAAEQQILVVPHKRLQNGVEYAYPNAGPGPWTDPPGEPVDFLWGWRAVLTLGDIVYKRPDGQKSIANLTVKLMHDRTIPVEGHKLYTIGDPIAAGITTVRL